MKKRLDLILVERGFFETREKAKREIMFVVLSKTQENNKVECQNKVTNVKTR